MGELIVGDSANQVWKKAVKLIISNGSYANGRSGETKELLHTFVSIENPQQKWIYDRVPPISIGFALAELVWIMNGKDEAYVINAWNPSLKKFAGEFAHYHGAYGKRIRSHFGFDQLDRAYYGLQSTPESRQFVIQIYDTKIDFPLNNGQPCSDDIPCNICSMPKIRDGKLEWTQIMRSNDVLLGMPYNFVQFTSLQEILAGWLGVKMGSYNHYSDSLHLYQRDYDKIGEDSTPIMINNDTLSVNKKESELLFKEIYARMKNLNKEGVSENEISKLSLLNSDYEAYNNIMIIIASYIAYKNRLVDLTNTLIRQCSNSIYRVIWDKWVYYKNRRKCNH